ncbi:unnamed protein product [Amoebophrya sp. A120]|nr:unnamed protein product [Amoebophrya sp. A120]|eukprot:GSA120T00015379001.1
MMSPSRRPYIRAGLVVLRRAASSSLAHALALLRRLATKRHTAAVLIVSCHSGAAAAPRATAGHDRAASRVAPPTSAAALPLGERSHPDGWPPHPPGCRPLSELGQAHTENYSADR